MDSEEGGQLLLMEDPFRKSNLAPRSPPKTAADAVESVPPITQTLQESQNLPCVKKFNYRCSKIRLSFKKVD